MNAERTSGMHRVLSDVADLAQLQLQLLAVDGREAGRRGIGAMLLLGVAGCLLIATVTVGLLGFGWVLHEMAGWPIGWSLLAMAAVACLITAAVLGLAYLSIKKAASALQETSAEFAENLSWIRAAMGTPRGPAVPYPGGYPPQAAYPAEAYSVEPHPAEAYATGPYPGGAAAGGGYPGASSAAAQQARAEHPEAFYSRH